MADLSSPAAEPRSGFRHAWSVGRGMGVLALLDLNAAVIQRTTGSSPGWWNVDDLPWIAGLEAAWPDIRAEFDAYEAARRIPTVERLHGMHDDARAGGDNIPGGSGGWKVLLLSSFGTPVAQNARHFPKTMAALAGTPAAANIGFSVMEAGSRIARHTDPNRGSLRVQLPIVVPEPPGSCAITVGDTEVPWEEGKAVAFDLACEHETRNDADAPRVLLLIETPMPLPFPASALNRLTQRAYAHLPTYDGIHERAAELAPEPEDLADQPVVPDAGPAVAFAGSSPRPTLADPEREAELEQFGFSVVPVLTRDQLAAVRAAYARLGPAPDDPQLAINWSFHSQSADYKRAVKAELLELAQPWLDELLIDHATYLTTFITKWPGDHGAFAPHQDPSLVDERFVRGVTVWLPLDDTGRPDEPDNGMLHVVPGSHRFSRSLRRNDVDEFEYADHERLIIEELGVGVPTRAGEALVFDNRIIHYSLPNRSTAPRVVLSFGVRPAEAPCILLRSVEPGLVGVHEIDDDFYIDVLPTEVGTHTPAAAPIAVLRPEPRRFTEDELRSLAGAVGPAPSTVPGRAADLVDPGAFCALCGSTEGLSAADREGRNNAQLVCPSCEARRAGDDRRRVEA